MTRDERIDELLTRTTQTMESLIQIIQLEFPKPDGSALSDYRVTFLIWERCRALKIHYPRTALFKMIQMRNDYAERLLCDDLKLSYKGAAELVNEQFPSIPLNPNSLRVALKKNGYSIPRRGTKRAIVKMRNDYVFELLCNNTSLSWAKALERMNAQFPHIPLSSATALQVGLIKAGYKIPHRVRGDG